MFENLSERLTHTIKKIKGYGRISEENTKEIMREIRLALLEADVNYQVVKEFTNNVQEKALGIEVQKSLNPADLFVKTINDELVRLLGNENAEITDKKGLNVIMLAGLQGSGKTTTAGKLALHIRKKNKKKPLLVASDVNRPAAIDQLKQIGKELDIPVYAEDSKDVLQIVKNAYQYALDNKFDYLIIDTAGRLHVDEILMKELKDIITTITVDESILVIDSMVGQDAIHIINNFREEIDLSGAILTKMDGDSKGGVALSLRYLTNIPIKFIGTSEKMDGLEPFYPDRIANRILGMGDIVSMVEKAEEVISEEEAKKLSKKMMQGKFDLEDFLAQMNQIKKFGPLENVIKMIPGAAKMGLNKVTIDPKRIDHIEAIVLAMTKEERANPAIIKGERKKRIARGSGRSVEEVNQLLKQFEQMKIMMKKMKGQNMKF